MSERLQIFVAEDNSADVYLIQEALSNASFNFELLRAVDGEDALNTLNRLEADASPVRVILLDLNLPKISGHELLAHVRNSSHLKAVPVIVMTSSDSPQDRAMAAGQKVDVYFRKPSNYEEFLTLGAIIKQLAVTGRQSLSLGCH